MKVAQLCQILCDPMDYIVHGILQARILEWVTFPFSRGIFPIQGSNPGRPHCRWILYQLRHKGSPRILGWIAYPFSSGSSQPGIKPGSPAFQVDSLPTELSWKQGKNKNIQSFAKFLSLSQMLTLTLNIQDFASLAKLSRLNTYILISVSLMISI